MDLLSLLILIVVLGLIYYLITLMPLPDPFKTIAIVIFIIVAILALVGFIPVHGIFIR